MVAIAWAIVVAAIFWADDRCVARDGNKYYGYETYGVLFLIASAGLIVTSIVELAR